MSSPARPSAFSPMLRCWVENHDQDFVDSIGCHDGNRRIGLSRRRLACGRAKGAHLRCADLDELAPAFEKATGNKLNIGYSLIADVRRRILDGETADVIILSRPVMDELQTRDKFAANSLVNVAGTPVSVAARIGAPKPDIHSVEAFKHTLLTARSIAYSDPAKGGASGVYFRQRPRSSRNSRADERKDHIGAGRPGPQKLSPGAKPSLASDRHRKSCRLPVPNWLARYPGNLRVRPFSPRGSVQGASHPKQPRHSLSS
jgi:hypothetical protein